MPRLYERHEYYRIEQILVWLDPTESTSPVRILPDILYLSTQTQSAWLAVDTDEDASARFTLAVSQTPAGEPEAITFGRSDYGRALVTRSTGESVWLIGRAR